LSWSSVRQRAGYCASPPRVFRVPNLAQYPGTWANRMNNVHFPPAPLLHEPGKPFNIRSLLRRRRGLQCGQSDGCAQAAETGNADRRNRAGLFPRSRRAAGSAFFRKIRRDRQGLTDTFLKWHGSVQGAGFELIPYRNGHRPPLLRSVDSFSPRFPRDKGASFFWESSDNYPQPRAANY